MRVRTKLLLIIFNENFGLELEAFNMTLGIIFYALMFQVHVLFINNLLQIVYALK
jgi:hypothetical protein